MKLLDKLAELFETEDNGFGWEPTPPVGGYQPKQNDTSIRTPPKDEGMFRYNTESSSQDPEDLTWLNIKQFVPGKDVERIWLVNGGATTRDLMKSGEFWFEVPKEVGHEWKIVDIESISGDTYWMEQLIPGFEE